jgi:Na+/proline symporter
MALVWSKASALGAISGAISGLVAGFIAWLVVCKAYYGARLLLPCTAVSGWSQMN